MQMVRRVVAENKTATEHRRLVQYNDGLYATERIYWVGDKRMWEVIPMTREDVVAQFPDEKRY